MEKNKKIKDHSISSEVFELRYDSELDYYTTYPVPTNLSEYYESDSYISHTDANTSLMDKVYQQIKKINLKFKLRLLDNQMVPYKTLLDIGAGTGDFLKTAQEAGWNCLGIEPNAKARKLALNKNITLIETIDEIAPQSFDVITLWHVLEHLPDLDLQINKISQLLDPNGTLIIAVPNFKSYDAKYYKSNWAAYDVPRHLHHFSKTSIERLFSKYGFVVEKIKPMIFDAYYVSMLSEKYKSQKHNYFIAFCIGTLSNLRALFTKEYSSLIYILKRT